MSVPLAEPIPPGDEHAISVSFPQWEHMVGWGKRDEKLIQQMKAGYPRFFIPLLVLELAQELVQRAVCRGVVEQQQQQQQQLALIFPHHHMARACRDFLQSRSEEEEEEEEEEKEKKKEEEERIAVLIADLKAGTIQNVQSVGWPTTQSCSHDQILMVMYPEALAPHAKAFWMHTGFGISSRCAAHWLTNLSYLPERAAPPLCDNRLDDDDDAMRTTMVAAAKLRIRERIAMQASSPLLTIQPADVTLYHTGMSAIWHSGQLIRQTAQRDSNPRKTQVAVFGFLYVDTIKVLERILGFDLVLYGNGSSEDLDRLHTDLQHSRIQIDAIYLEFPGNPLLRSPDLHRIWSLSRRYHFRVIVDDTVATMSLDLAPYCDIVCISLTKMFSGACNVMGGSLILPRRRRRRHSEQQHEEEEQKEEKEKDEEEKEEEEKEEEKEQEKEQQREEDDVQEEEEEEEEEGEEELLLHRTLQDFYVDTYFPLDAIVMDQNSENFPQRMKTASRNAEHLVALFQQHPQVAEVFYPKGSASQRFYDVFKRPDAGYGYLLSVRFISPAAAHTFYDALDVAKGPSLGTEFTLCCAYTWLAHASELDWAAEFGVVEDLVRISTGAEPWDHLKRIFDHALAAM